MLIAGAHPFANPDGTSDLARLANKVNAYQLTRQVLLREFPEREMLLVQTRQIQAPIDSDLVISTDDGAADRQQASGLVNGLISRMEDLALTTRFVDGSEATAGYELGLLLQAASLNHAVNKQTITAWLSPVLRQSFRDPTFLSLMESQFTAIGIPTVEHELYEYIASMGDSNRTSRFPDVVCQAIRGYCQNGDVIHLYRLTQEFPDFKLVRVIDTSSDQSFLLVQSSPRAQPDVFNLEGDLNSATVTCAIRDADAVRRFARARQFHLNWEAAP